MRTGTKETQKAQYRSACSITAFAVSLRSPGLKQTQTFLGPNPGVESFTSRVVEVVRSIPKGKVATYGQVARLAGNPNGARQVVRVLWSQSEKERLPWHRIINAQGRIALTGEGFRMQRSLLKQEGVKVAADGAIDLKRHQWSP